MTVVGTWNLENLYRPGAATWRPSTDAVYQAKLSALAHTVTALAPDVLAVQEVGEPAALDDLVAAIGGEWHVAVSAFPDSRGIRVGMLSRLPIDDTAEVVDFPPGIGPLPADDDGGVSERMGRGALRVRVRTAGGTALDVATCHLKSKLLTFPGGRFTPRDEGERARHGAYAIYRRSAEAATLRTDANAVLAGAGAERALVVCGDLNDDENAATTQLFLGPGGSEIGTPGERRPDDGDGARLWNVAPLIPAERRYSRVYRGRRELIDHALVSRFLLDRIRSVDAAVDRGLPSISDFPNARADAPDSDHAPVLVDLDV